MHVKHKLLVFYARFLGLEKQLHPMHFETNQQRLLSLCLRHTKPEFQSLSGVFLFSQMPLAEPFPDKRILFAEKFPDWSRYLRQQR